MNNKPIFRMSSAGKCPRALSAQLLNIKAEPKPAFVEKAAEEGNWHEKRIKEQLYTEDELFVGNEQREVILEYPSFNLVGHIDGMVSYKEGDKLLEIKTMSQFEFDRWMKGGFKAFLNYADQITCYMEATGLSECLYIVKNRSSGYEDRRVLTEKPSHMTEIIGHLTDVTNHITSNLLVPKEFDPQSIECRRCEYKKLCIPEPKELTPIEEAGLSAASEDWRKGKELVTQGQELVDRAREVFEEHTKATNILKWRHSSLAIQLVQYKESKTYPKTKLLEVFTKEQLEPASQVKEAFDQLRITDLEKEGNNVRTKRLG